MLSENLELLNSIIEETSDAVYAKDIEGRYILFNDAAAKITGKSAAEILGKDDTALFPPDIACTVMAMDSEIRSSGVGQDFDHLHVSITGNEIVTHGSKRPLRDSQGNIIGVFGISRDVTAIRRAEAEIKELNRILEARVAEAVDELRQKDQMMIVQDRQAVLGSMINSIAHQWRQPLNLLGLLVQQMPLCHNSDKHGKEFLKENAADAMALIEFMSQTIDDFRSFFMPDKGVVAFDVHKQISRTMSLIGKSFAEQRIVIELNCADKPVAYGHPNEFAQVLLNILMNAQDALIGNSVNDARISIKAFETGGKAVVTVADNAGGIDETIIGRLFDQYFTTKEVDKGTGIGLYMAKNIIEKKMGGSLTVCNAGSGAEFRIEIGVPLE